MFVCFFFVIFRLRLIITKRKERESLLSKVRGFTWIYTRYLWWLCFKFTYINWTYLKTSVVLALILILNIWLDIVIFIEWISLFDLTWFNWLSVYEKISRRKYAEKQETNEEGRDSKEVYYTALGGINKGKYVLESLHDVQQWWWKSYPKNKNL